MSRKKDKGPATIQNVALADQVRLLQRTLSAMSTSLSITLASAFEEWLDHLHSNAQSKRTADRCHHDCQAFINSITNNERIDVCDVTAVQINKWLNAEGPAKASTRILWLSSVKVFFSWCMEKQYCQVDPSKFSIVRVDMRKLSHEQKEPRYQEGFSDEDIEKLMAHILKNIDKCLERKKLCEKMDWDFNYAEEAELDGLRFFRSAIPIARWSSQRIGDICKLEWACFSRPGKMVVWTSKRNRRVELDIPPEVMDAISVIEIKDNKYCFPRQKKMIEGPSRANLSARFGKLCKAVGLKCTSFHQLRHAFAQDMKSNGFTLEQIGAMMAHRSTTTTSIYTTPHAKPQPQQAEGTPIQSLDCGGGAEIGSQGIDNHRSLLPGPVSETQSAA